MNSWITTAQGSADLLRDVEQFFLFIVVVLRPEASLLLFLLTDFSSDVSKRMTNSCEVERLADKYPENKQCNVQCVRETCCLLQCDQNIGF